MTLECAQETRLRFAEPAEPSPLVEAEALPLVHMPTRESIVALQKALLARPDVQIECEVRHTFAPGVYVREMFIPAGAVIVGKRHKTEHVAMLTKGRMSVWTEDGIQTIEAPLTIVSKPGTKRVGYAHTDSVFVNIHPTNETDLSVIESQVIEPEPPEDVALVTQELQACLGV